MRLQRLRHQQLLRRFRRIKLRHHRLRTTAPEKPAAQAHKGYQKEPQRHISFIPGRIVGPCFSHSTARQGLRCRRARGNPSASLRSRDSIGRVRRPCHWRHKRWRKAKRRMSRGHHRLPMRGGRRCRREERMCLRTESRRLLRCRRPGRRLRRSSRRHGRWLAARRRTQRLDSSLDRQTHRWLVGRTGSNLIRFHGCTACAMRAGHHGPLLLRQRKKRAQTRRTAQTDDSIDHWVKLNAISHPASDLSIINHRVQVQSAPARIRTENQGIMRPLNRILKG